MQPIAPRPPSRYTVWRRRVRAARQSPAPAWVKTRLEIAQLRAEAFALTDSSTATAEDLIAAELRRSKAQTLELHLVREAEEKERNRLANAPRTKPVKGRDRRGRAEYDEDAESRMLVFAASVITLARKHGRRGFVEASLHVYPDGDHAPSTGDLKQPYPPAPEILTELADSKLRAPLLLVHAINVCRPWSIDPRLSLAALKYAKRVARLPDKPPSLRAVRSIKILRLALVFVFEWNAYCGRFPRQDRASTVPRLLKEFGFTARMRSYWKNVAPGAVAARQLVAKLAPANLQKNRDIRPAWSSASLDAFKASCTRGTRKRALEKAILLFEASPPMRYRSAQYSDNVAARSLSESAIETLGEAITPASVGAADDFNHIPGPHDGYEAIYAACDL